MTFVTTILPAVSPKLARKLSDLLSVKFCFPADTDIRTAEGAKPIEEVSPGDLVWAQDARTGAVSLKPVTRVFASICTSLTVLSFGAVSIECTPSHPLWIADQGWKAAEQIVPGDELITWSGEKLAVTRIEAKHGRFAVYNFEVAEALTYFAGEPGILAHNTCKIQTAGAVVPKGTKSLGRWGEARLTQVLNGMGYKPKTAFQTSLGARFIDRLDNGIAHEAKAGLNVKLNSRLETQILKDAELISSKAIRGAHWHFFQGAQQDVLDFLTKHGIPYTVY